MRRLGTLGVVLIPYLLLVAIGTISDSSPILVQLDPTIRFWGAAAVLAIPYIWGINVFERLLSKAAPAPKTWWRTLLLSWIGVLIVLGAANILSVYSVSEATWVNLELFVFTGAFWLTGLILIFLHFGKNPQPISN